MKHSIVGLFIMLVLASCGTGDPTISFSFKQFNDDSLQFIVCNNDSRLSVFAPLYFRVRVDSVVPAKSHTAILCTPVSSDDMAQSGQNRYSFGGPVVDGRCVHPGDCYVVATLIGPHIDDVLMVHFPWGFSRPLQLSTTRKNDPLRVSKCVSE